MKKKRICIRCGKNFVPWEQDPERCEECGSPQVVPEYPRSEDDD